MAALISHTSLDSLDAHAQSVFWGHVLGFAEDPDDPNEPGHEECMIFSVDSSRRLLFIQVPDVKQVKNRVHLDLKPAEGTRDQELERLLRLGALEVADRRDVDGAGSCWPTRRATSSASCAATPNAPGRPEQRSATGSWQVVGVRVPSHAGSRLWQRSKERPADFVNLVRAGFTTRPPTSGRASHWC